MTRLLLALALLGCQEPHYTPPEGPPRTGKTKTTVTGAECSVTRVGQCRYVLCVGGNYGYGSPLAIAPYGECNPEP